MAYRIDPDLCTACGGCEYECPNKAIKLKGGAFVINPAKCTECEGFFDTPQCAAACPSNACVPG
jgi:ferredoxin